MHSRKNPARGTRNLALVLLALAGTFLPPAGARAQAPRPDVRADSRPAFESIETPGFGPVRLFRPTGTPRAFALFASGDGEWNEGLVDMVRELLDQGYTVAGFSTPAWLAKTGRKGGPCAYPAGEFEILAHDLERREGFTRYATPLLVGYSSGAALVYSALAQAPAGTFAGAISLAFCPDLALDKPLCAGRALHSRPRARPPRMDFDATQSPGLEDPWVVLQGENDRSCPGSAVAGFVGATPGGEFVPLPGVAHEFDGHATWLPKYREALARFAPAAAPVAAGSNPDRGVGGLPLTEVPATGPAVAVFTIFYSGDGGWREFDRAVSAQLALAGIAGVGWDSLQYFWSAHTPDAAAADLARVIRHYRAAWQKSRVVLVGYSFGADALPLILAKLPAAERSTIALVTLIAPGPNGNLEFHVSDWLGGTAHRASVPLVPAIRALSPTPVLCLYGSLDQASSCRGLVAPGVTVAELPGDHHFNGDTARVAAEIRRLAAE